MANNGPKTFEGLLFVISFNKHPRATSESTILGEHNRSESAVHRGKVLFDGDDNIPLGEWEADRIIGKEIINNVIYYMVAWKPTLELINNLGHMKELI